MKITLRQAKEEDYEFLWNLHKTTMKSYVDETWGWDEEFQEKYFSNRFEANNIQLIILDDTTIGAIEIQDRENELFVASFEIAPQFQNKGIGSTILKRIINTSDNKQKSLKLQVLKVNPAKRFYKQFGFETVDETKTHFIMKRSVA
ncbi:GNAT family N-acetyltransferase [Fodinibius sp. Rm-B-1B1-1]|uniref:GNAT family N-acetyltransferase n=1 Tax=Fodinibius alkaliphilus TaxID=3140241 RepID=UPI00315B1C51